jgi:hypothetical protein
LSYAIGMWTLRLPNGAEVRLEVIAAAHVVGAVLAIVIVAAITIRLAQVFVRGIARALLNRESLEGTAQGLTAD